jgi:transcription elongation factor GreB
MSRAFIKEPDGDQLSAELPERPQSPYINYVSPEGLRQLQARVRQLGRQKAALSAKDDLASRQQLLNLERDLRYYEERLQRAVSVDPQSQPDDKVHFGATVEVHEETGETFKFTIVGEDEAEAGSGKISWISPLATALLDARVGDIVIWQRPAGNKELEIVSISKGGS